MTLKDYSKIKNVIWDVGGVLLDYRWQDMLMDFGYSKDSAIYSGSRILNDPLWRDMDKGTYTESEVIAKYREMFPEDKELVSYMFENAHLMHLPRFDLYPVIESLYDKGYDLYVLSNYSERLFNIHTEKIPFLDKCCGIVLSCKIGMLKPEAEIYRYILDTYSLSAEECLFLDDNEDNVAGAVRCGFNSICVKTEADVRKAIAPLLD